MTLDEIFNQLIVAKIAEVFGPNYGKIRDNLNGLIERYRAQFETNKQLLQKISELEKTVSTLSLSIDSTNRNIAGFQSQLEIQQKRLTDGINAVKEPYNAQIDSIIAKFNNWAANPIGVIPSGFTFLAGDFRIRTQQVMTETAEETKWITNSGGGKKYLLPNPNMFNQMTNISELYTIDQRMLKEKGKNKIQIIKPCEILSHGWIAFTGEIKILP
jgi:hypothetical protein